MKYKSIKTASIALVMGLALSSCASYQQDTRIWGRAGGTPDEKASAHHFILTAFPDPYVVNAYEICGGKVDGVEAVSSTGDKFLSALFGLGGYLWQPLTYKVYCN